MSFFNLPNSQNSTGQSSGCPPGYIRVGNACVNPLTQEIYKLVYSSGYDFEYYENAGELVGRYNVFADNIPESEEHLLGDTQQVDNAATYFSQNVNVTKLKYFGLVNPTQALSHDDSVLFIEVKHTDQGTAPALVEIQHPFIPTNSINLDPSILNTFYFGEFHFLTNTLKSLKRFNCNFQLLQNMKEVENWQYLKMPATTIPTLFEVDSARSFLQMYFGFSKVSQGDRPPTLDRSEFPSIMNPILGTDWLTWGTLNTTCQNYMRVYNGSIPRNYFESSKIQDGHFICQTKVIVDQGNLTTYFNSTFDSSLYPVNGNTGNREMYYQIILYSPSFYLYPAKNPTNIIAPVLNFVNDQFNQIQFQVPANYKSDGNIHYKVEFYLSKGSETPYFVSSSYSGDPAYESLAWFELDQDMKSYIPITEGLPSDDNIYNDGNGTDAKDSVYIKYILTEECNIALQNKSDIIFKIKQLDGTLIEPYLNN